MRTFKTYFFYSISLLFLCFLSSGCDDLFGPNKPQDTGKLLLDTVVNTSFSDVSVIISDKLTIIIPKGSATGTEKLTVTSIDPGNAPKSDVFNFYELFEIKLGTITKFDKPLKITIKYDPAKGNSGIFKDKMGVASYNEALKVWNAYSNVLVDTVLHTISFETNHLTKLGRYGLRNLEGYTDFRSTSHFYIYWTEGDVVSNSDYVSPYRATNVGTDPHYIQDIAYYLEQAYDKYKSLGLSVHSGKVNVFVHDIGDDDGNSSFLGYLNINRKLKPEGDKTMEVMLPSVCAHEYLHYVQDYYYMLLFADYTTKWWMEATATQGDIMVWPGKSFVESEWYADVKLGEQLGRSWDDCNEDPNWYVAGGFLRYISAYRTGSKASISQLIKDGGSNTSVSHIRTVIDDYLKSSLSSEGIGREYCNYIKWAYQHDGPITINRTPPSTKSNPPYAVPVILAPNLLSKTAEASIPRLAVKMVKILNTTDNSAVKLIGKSIPANVTAYIYKTSSAGAELVKELKLKDTISVDLAKGAGWIDILMVNTSKDEAATIAVDISMGNQLDGKWNVHTTPISDACHEWSKDGETIVLRFTVKNKILNLWNIEDEVGGDFDLFIDKENFVISRTDGVNIDGYFTDNDHWQADITIISTIEDDKGNEIPCTSTGKMTATRVK